VIGAGLYYPPGRYRTNARDAEEFLVFSPVDIHREEPGLSPGDHHLGILGQREVTLSLRARSSSCEEKP